MSKAVADQYAPEIMRLLIASSNALRSAEMTLWSVECLVNRPPESSPKR